MTVVLHNRTPLAPPTFLPTNDSVTVVLHNRTPPSVEDRAWLALLADLDLSPAETRLVVAVHRRVARGLVVQRGQRGGARYALSDEIVLRAGARGSQARDRRRQTLSRRRR